MANAETILDRLTIRSVHGGLVIALLLDMALSSVSPQPSSPILVELVPVWNPLHELLRRQREQHAVRRDRYERRGVHDLLPVADAGHSSAAGSGSSSGSGSGLGRQSTAHKQFRGKGGELRIAGSASTLLKRTDQSDKSTCRKQEPGCGLQP